MWEEDEEEQQQEELVNEEDRGRFSDDSEDEEGDEDNVHPSEASDDEGGEEEEEEEDDDISLSLFDEPSGEEGCCGTASEICEMEVKLKKAKIAHQKRIQTVIVKLNTRLGWLLLPRQTRKTHIPTILYCLQQRKEKMPQCMTSWSKFRSEFPNTVCSNKEVLIAFLQSDASEFDPDPDAAEFPIPNRLRGDEELILAICKNYSPHAGLSKATKVLQNNGKFVVAAVASDPSAFQYASSKLKNDRKIVRQVLSMPGGIRAFPFLSKKLKKDTKLAILAIQKAGSEYAKSHEHLLDLPEHFWDDEEVVLEAVKRRGSNFRHITDNSLKKNIEIIDLACRDDGSNLLLVPNCYGRRQMLETKSAVMSILSTPGSGMCLDLAPRKFQEDRECILLAVQNGYTSERLGQFYDSGADSEDEEDNSFFFRLISESSNIDDLYKKLSRTLQKDEMVIRAVIHNDALSNETMVRIMDRTESLGHREIKKAVQRGFFSFLEVLDIEKKLALKLCRINGSCLVYIGPGDECQRDVEFLLAALNSREPIPIRTLLSLPSCSSGSDLWTNADFVEAVVRAAAGEDKDWKLRIGNRVPDGFRNRNVYLACLECNWSTRGKWPGNWGLLGGSFGDFLDDEEIALAVLKFWLHPDVVSDYGALPGRYSGNRYHCLLGPDTLFRSWPRNAGNRASLYRNRAFMERAVLVDPGALHHNRYFRGDFDLYLRAVASSREALMKFQHTGKSWKELIQFAVKLRKKMEKTDNFVLDFLGAISIQSPPPKKRGRRSKKQSPKSICHLPMLNLGGETGSSLKRLIAEYAGIAVGPKYKLMRDASDHLALFGY